VKRAFAPVKFILRRSTDKKTVRVMGCNDTPEEKKVALEYGYVSLSGKYDSAKKNLTLPAFSKGIVLEFPMPKGDVKNGLIFARGDGSPLALLRTGTFRSYAPAESEVIVTKVETKGKDHLVTLKSTGYSHAVSLGLKAAVHLDDDFFDMLPGDVRVITVKGAPGKLEKESVKPVYLKTLRRKPASDPQPADGIQPTGI
jgi:beta-mannosidase